MARVINGVLCFTSKEMADKVGGTRAMWAYYAREGKVPAFKWIDSHWYFNLDDVNDKARINSYKE